MRNSHLIVIFAALSILINIALFFPLIREGVVSWRKPEQASGSGAAYAISRKYVAYIGLNDKDTGTQLVSRDEARKMLNAVAAGHVDGFTVIDGHGYWKKGDTLDNEETLVYIFYNATEQQVKSALEAMRIAMNQRAILIERDDALLLFHEG